MFKIFLKLRYLAGIALFGVSFLGYRIARVAQSEHEQLQEQLAWQVARDVSREVAKTAEDGLLVVAGLERDPDAVLASNLRSWLDRQGVAVWKPSWTERAWGWVTGANAAGSEAATVQSAAELGAEYVMLGRVNKVVTDPESLHMEAELHVLETESGERVFHTVARVPRDPQSGDGRSDANESADEAAVGQTPVLSYGIPGFCVWLTVMLLLPLVAAHPIGRMLRKESNGVNAAMLAVYVLLGGVLGWLLWVGNAGGFLRWSLLLVMGVVSLFYFGFICQQIERSGA